MTKLLDLPPELGVQIASHLDAKDAISLACASPITFAIGESRAWRSIRVVSSEHYFENEEAVMQNELSWARLADALDRRRSRRGQIRSIHCDLTSRTIPQLLDLVTPPSAVTDVQVERILGSSSPLAVQSSIIAISFGPVLSSLTHLTIVEERSVSDEDIYACLANTPNLTSFAVRMAYCASGRPTPIPVGRSLQNEIAEQHADEEQEQGFGPIRRRSLHLPKLKEFCFHSADSLDAAATITENAPALETLYIQCHRSPLSEAAYEGDPAARRHALAQALSVLRNGRIRCFDAESVFTPFLCSTDGAARAPDNWMPALKRLIAWGLPRPGRMPKHEGVEWLTCWDAVPRDLSHLLGTFPSPVSTGLIAPWLVSSLQDLPCLTRLDVQFDWKAYADWPRRPVIDEQSGFRLMVFENPAKGETLVHARILQPTGKEATLLGHHCMSYTPNNLDWFKAVTYDDDRDLNPIRPVAQVPPSPDSDVTEGVLDFTCHRDRPLSKSDLRWVYGESGLDWEWTEGERDVRLPGRVWEHLAVVTGEARTLAEGGDGLEGAGGVLPADEHEGGELDGEENFHGGEVDPATVADNAHDLASYFGHGLHW